MQADPRHATKPNPDELKKTPMLDVRLKDISKRISEAASHRGIYNERMTIKKKNPKPNQTKP